MARKFKSACVTLADTYDPQGGYWVFFSDRKEKPDVLRHDSRKFFLNKEEAIAFAKKWVQKQGQVFYSGPKKKKQ